jgi:hypothetical protein
VASCGRVQGVLAAATVVGRVVHLHDTVAIKAVGMHVHPIGVGRREHPSGAEICEDGEGQPVIFW